MAPKKKKAQKIPPFLVKLGITPDEMAIIRKVFMISATVFGAVIVGITAMNFFAAQHIKNEALKLAAPKVMEVDKLSYFKENKGKMLPIDIEAHRLAAKVVVGPDALAKRIDHLSRALSLDPSDAPTQVDLAEAFIEAGTPQKGLDILEPLASYRDEETNDLTCKIRSDYGLALFYTGRHEASRDHLLKSISELPNCPEAYCYLGQVQASFDMSDTVARSYLEKSIDLKPDYTEGYYQLARWWMNLANRDSTNYLKARNLLLKVLELEPLHQKAHSRLAMVYYYINQPSLSEKSYLTAIRLNQWDYNTYYNFGELYFNSYVAYDKALRQYQKAIEIKSDHTDANFKIGIILMNNNQVKEAVDYFNRARNTAPTNVRILLQLAVGYEKLEHIDKAIEIYKEVLTYDELNNAALMKLRLLKTE